MWGTNVSEPRPDVLVLQMPLHTCVHGLDPHREGYLFLYFSCIYCIHVCMYVCMYVCTYVYLFDFYLLVFLIYVCICMHTIITRKFTYGQYVYVCLFVCMYVCLYRQELLPNKLMHAPHCFKCF